MKTRGSNETPTGVYGFVVTQGQGSPAQDVVIR